ncbi:serine hydroxymethyltransferase [Pasteuria penetrans]|uniref:serine hydroxymethyltransferase n=1 Tax=Pasteuria penetrans TaxID=86005 RepID=UPI0011EFF9A7|nr:serine hydroxymethyltransferase [Pasteuria penetrans]
MTMYDSQIEDLLARELERQRGQLNLIASENFVSEDVLRAVGTIPTNKYAEGYPGRRYYAGCEYVDGMEDLARQRALRLFPGSEYVNVQPHCGTQANMAVYFSLLEPGDVVMGMNLGHGGHLTHGSPYNFSGKLYKFIPYGVDSETHRIDYDQVLLLAEKHRPKLVVSGASAYPRVIDFERMAAIAQSVNAFLLADVAHIAGLIAGQCHPSPFPHADFVTMTTHKTLRGPRGGMVFCRKEMASRLDRGVFPVVQGGPFMHGIVAKAVAFQEALQPDFVEYAHRVVANARSLADSLQEGGISLVSGGTDNHLVLVDTRGVELTGREAEAILEEVGIVGNKNMIPYDSQAPMVTSGMRFGTAALTTRGLDAEDMRRLGGWIAARLRNPGSREVADTIRMGGRELLASHPLYEGLG